MCLKIKKEVYMKKIFKRFGRLKREPKLIIIFILIKLSFFFPDKLYLQLMFRCRMGYKLNLSNPKSFSEKLQWLKLYNRNPLYTTLVDKYAVKEYVAKLIGVEHIIPTLGVWDDARNIDFDSLPEQFVLKTTNGGGGDVVICKNKADFDKNFAVKHLNEGLKKSIYKSLREWPYKNVKPRIIAEKYMDDGDGGLKDYKFFCFDGVVFCLQVDYDRFVDHCRNIYDVNWNKLPFSICFPSKEGYIIDKPKDFEKMLKIAQRLSYGFPHLRVDLYNIKGEIFFGELTFFHGSGYEKFMPNEWDCKFGELLQLPKEKIC